MAITKEIDRINIGQKSHRLNYSSGSLNTITNGPDDVPHRGRLVPVAGRARRSGRPPLWPTFLRRPRVAHGRAEAATLPADTGCWWDEPGTDPATEPGTGEQLELILPQDNEYKII